MRKHWNRGRKREAGARFICGKLDRSARADAPLALSRRAEVVGAENAEDQRAGTALGIALFVGALGHYDSRAVGERGRQANAAPLRRWFAGALFSRVHQQWARLEMIPPRSVAQPSGGRLLRDETTDEAAFRIRARWRDATAALSSAGLCAYRAVDAVVLTS